METATTEVLPEEAWRERAEAHRARVDAYVAPHLARREAQVKHPVFDFLFTYYSHRPAQLRRWHPGSGIVLTGGTEEYGGLKGYEPAPVAEVRCDRASDSAGRGTSPKRWPRAREQGAERPGAPAPSLETSGAMTVAASYVSEQRPLLAALHRLLTATASRAPHFGCFGLHEWAMVYRLSEDQTRHAAWPLRLGAAGTDEVVESHRIACSHFDAYRFFTPQARPLNTLAPGRDDRPDYEQPGCFHAGMDLYKHAFRLSPMICSDLVADCFELAWDIRVMDMRAAPYDLADLGFEPVRIETPDGKQEYVAAQRTFADRAAPLRQRLIAECERLLA